MLRRVCPEGPHDLVRPESAVPPVWPYGARRPVEGSRWASACRACSLSGRPRVGVGADRHGVCGHPHRGHDRRTRGHGLGGRPADPGHRTAVACGPRHGESLGAPLGGAWSERHAVVLASLALTGVPVGCAVDLQCQAGRPPDAVGATGRHRWGCLGMDRLQSGAQTCPGLGGRHTPPLRCATAGVPAHLSTRWPDPLLDQ